jgi:hypothetical protein
VIAQFEDSFIAVFDQAGKTIIMPFQNNVEN